MKPHRLITRVTLLAAALVIVLPVPRTASSPSPTEPPAIELRAVSSSCYEFSLADPRIPADSWRVSFRFGGSQCLRLSSFSGTDGELVGIVCCAGTGLLCQEQLLVSGSRAGQPVFTVSRTINCP